MPSCQVDSTDVSKVSIKRVLVETNISTLLMQRIVLTACEIVSLRCVCRVVTSISMSSSQIVLRLFMPRRIEKAKRRSLRAPTCPRPREPWNMDLKLRPPLVSAGLANTEIRPQLPILSGVYSEHVVRDLLKQGILCFAVRERFG